jgi:hypothetical protein
LETHIHYSIPDASVLAAKVTGIKVEGFYMPPASRIGGRKGKNTERAHQSASVFLRSLAGASNRRFTTVQDIVNHLEKELKIKVGLGHGNLITNLENLYTAWLVSLAKKNPVFHDDKDKNQEDGREVRKANTQFLRAHERATTKPTKANETLRGTAKINLASSSFSTPPPRKGVVRSEEDRAHDRVRHLTTGVTISGSPFKARPSDIFPDVDLKQLPTPLRDAWGKTI